MANWHARVGSLDGNSFEILYHIPIPSANNRVGVNYRAALIGSGIGGTTKMTEGIAAGQITTAEKTQIVAGEVYEYTETIFTNPGETDVQLQAKVDARYTTLVTVLQDQLQKRLTYWGHSHDVV